MAVDTILIDRRADLLAHFAFHVARAMTIQTPLGYHSQFVFFVLMNVMATCTSHLTHLKTPACGHQTILVSMDINICRYGIARVV